MPQESPQHCIWFENTGADLQTSDEKEVLMINFNHALDNQDILNDWATQFRANYCSETDLESGRAGTGLSRADYLRDRKFPNRGSIRAGDFAELLVADYLQFLLGYVVPRTRYDRKINPNSSTQGVDIVGFKFSADENASRDELITCEVKARFTATTNTLQDSIDGSKKDFETRLPLALNAMKQRLLDRNDVEGADQIARFENKTAKPYKEVSGAAFVCSRAQWSEDLVTASVSNHPNENTLYFTFVGDDFMALVNRLYETAYATA